MDYFRFVCTHLILNKIYVDRGWECTTRQYRVAIWLWSWDWRWWDRRVFIGRGLCFGLSFWSTGKWIFWWVWRHWFWTNLFSLERYLYFWFPCWECFSVKESRVVFIWRFNVPIAEWEQLRRWRLRRWFLTGKWFGWAVVFRHHWAVAKDVYICCGFTLTLWMVFWANYKL